VESASSPAAVPMLAFATVWLTLFLDLVGFGIILPVLPFYAQDFGASPGQVTLLSAAFSAAQFGMAPVLGRLGDRHGRRPVMLISIAGSCAAMLVLGFAQGLWMVFAARVVGGMSSANISTAQAYVADRVAPKERARYMGMMGSAIGLGFVFGPAIGGLLSMEDHPELPFLVAAGLAGVNWVLAWRFLPEGRRVRKTVQEPVRVGFAALPGTLRRLWGTQLGWLVFITFMFYLAFSSMESTFALLMEAQLSWTARETGYLFTGIGVVIVLTQGVAVGRIVRAVGEKRTLLVGMVVLATGLATTGTATGVVLVVLGAAGIACGNGLVTPSISALVSRSSGADDQGLNLGLNQASASLARIAGPTAAGFVFEALGPGVPMQLAAGCVVIGAVTAAITVRRPHDA
jgi:MFS family permease